MKAKRLNQAFEFIDDKYLDIAEKEKTNSKRTPWMKFGAIAACLCLAAVIGTIALTDNDTGINPHDSSLPSDSGLPSSVGTLPSDFQSSSIPENNTPKSYGNLTALLAKVSKNDYHEKNDELSDRFSGNSISSTLATPDSTAAYGSYVYRLDNGLLKVYNNGEYVAELTSAAGSMLVCNDTLILISSLYADFTDTHSKNQTIVELYDISTANNPVRKKTFVQKGSIVACFSVNSQLYLMTYDGLCACGWSADEDLSEYFPSVNCNGEEAEWANDEISVLGEPTRIEYVTLTCISSTSGEITSKHAYYGNIQDIFYGSEQFSFAVQSTDESMHTRPEIFIFSLDTLTLTGSVDTAEVFGLEKSVKLYGFNLPDGEYPEITEVYIDGTSGICRIIGTYNTFTQSKSSAQLMVISLNLNDNSVTHSLFKLSGSDFFSIDDIIWESNRAIISTSCINTSTYTESANIVFVELEDMSAEAFESSFSLEKIAGIDMMYRYGKPHGSIKPFIPMGNGIYLRYNEKPDGFDIFDFSDSANPTCIYRSPRDSESNFRYEFKNCVYDENTFAVMKITPNENGEYRNVTYSWEVYSVDIHSENPFTLIGEYSTEEFDRTNIR